MWQKLDVWSDGFNMKMQETKDRYLRPIVFCLQQIGLTANSLSTLKVMIGGLAVVVIKWDIGAAVVIFLITYLIDIFDGSLARYAGQNTDRGKFIDVLTDQAAYILVVLALIRVDFLDVKILAFNLIAVPVLYLLVVVERNEGKPTDWIIKPVAKASYYKTPFLLAVMGVIMGILKISVANWVLHITNILVGLHIIFAYAKILGKNKYKNI